MPAKFVLEIFEKERKEPSRRVEMNPNQKLKNNRNQLGEKTKLKAESEEKEEF